MNIREAEEKDSKQIAEIYNHYISSTVVTFEEDEITEAEVGSRINTVFRSGLWWQGKIMKPLDFTGFKSNFVV